MGLLNKGRQTKVCPRCKNKCLISDVRCDDCGLVFARLDDATNKMAKKRFKAKEKEQIVYVKKAKDVKRWKLIILTILFGLAGAQYYYVGRWKMGLFMTICNIGVILCGSTVFFNAQLNAILGQAGMSIIGVIVGIYGVLWLNDIVRVCFGKFPIPVSLMTEDEIKEEQEIERLKKEYLKEKTEKKNNLKAKKKIKNKDSKNHDSSIEVKK